MSEPHPRPQPEAQPPPGPPVAVPARAHAPALLYVLAAFGVVFGGWGSIESLNVGLALLTPRDGYVEKVKTARMQTYDSLQALSPTMMPSKAEFERFSEREGDARYGRRNAALPLALVGVILSCLLFAGCTRTMLGDPWGLGAWSLAALASIPFQTISTVLALVTSRDLARSLGETSPILSLQLHFQEIGTLIWAGTTLLYYGACVLYLRAASVRARFSGAAGRTPPSA
jgi:hypothetical protein